MAYLDTNKIFKKSLISQDGQIVNSDIKYIDNYFLRCWSKLSFVTDRLGKKKI